VSWQVVSMWFMQACRAHICTHSYTGHNLLKPLLNTVYDSKCYRFITWRPDPHTSHYYVRYMCTNRACSMLSIHMNISVYMKNIARLLQYNVSIYSDLTWLYAFLCQSPSRAFWTANMLGCCRAFIWGLDQ